MNQPDEQQHQDVAPNSSRVLSLVVIGGIIAAGCFFYTKLSRQKAGMEDALSSSVQQNEELQRQLANLQATVSDIEAAKLSDREQQVLVADDMTAVLDQAKQIQISLGDLQRSKTEWEAALRALKTNDNGKKIASDPALVDLIVNILTAVPPDNIVDNMSNRLTPMIAQLERALASANPSFQPSEAFTNRLMELSEQASQTSAWYRDHARQLAVVADKSNQLRPASRTLVAALASREDDRAQERVERLAAQNRELQRQKEAAQAEAQKIIAEAEANAARLVGQATADKIKQAALEEKAKHEEEIRRRQAAEQLAQLKRDFQRDLADIRVKLAPFLADGYTYNSGGRKGPVSLKQLQGQGAFEEGRKGLEKLLYIGGTSTNDRDRGAFPQYVGSEFAWRQVNKDFLAQAQAYLIKYGQLLVEQEMLEQ